MDVSPEVVDRGIRLTESLARNTATAITDKIRALKASGKKDEAIAGIEELVSGLIADKAELARFAQAYQSELVAQRLSAGDVKYIAETVLPLIENLARATGAQGAAVVNQVEALKPLLSVETANVLQILRFNFRKANAHRCTRVPKARRRPRSSAGEPGARAVGLHAQRARGGVDLGGEGRRPSR